MKDEHIELLAETMCAGFWADVDHSEGIWAPLPPVTKGDWRRAARAGARTLAGNAHWLPAVTHMTAAETELLGYLDEYEANRDEDGRLADATAELAAFRIAEHFALIRAAIYRGPR